MGPITVLAAKGGQETVKSGCKGGFTELREPLPARWYARSRLLVR